ncbi:hypothetical protein VC83_01262 [Pseudogymnoascus destructans]|uniref:Amidoligase enzyme n=2 Tax=Pseudogymnoascus destructans TaxID=655981 RepID=L8G5A4_PSED2|nr:uncharacterized protein VC83_01262 [Pseudogymnoascus destructans]ELR08450.1 hypothetical protein GMDG_00514 [Pseudogymnoascus destructans 20631-21]OAF62730.1 hypothetical protein VC83_01262 [Pseudogymnoascus destructans]
MPAAFTFGIEVEYLVPFIYTGDIDPEPKDRRTIDRTPPNTNDFSDATGIVIDNRVYDRVRRTLRDVGLPAAVMPELPIGSLPTQWEPVRDESLVEDDDMADLYGNCFVPLEIRSPVLSADRAGFRAVRLAIDALVSKHRLLITDTCGYHVHVGKGKEGFSLPALKNIAAFLWVFGPQLGTLHPPYRHTIGYASSMRKRSNISHHAEDLREGIREIYAAKTARRLVYLIHWTDPDEKFESDDVFIRNMAYNFVNIVHEEGKKTIEFRQFCSTTDSLHVKMWAEVCTGIVMACSERSEAEWSAFLYDAAATEESRPKVVLNIAQLLSRIGLGDQANWAQQRSQELGYRICSIQ